MEIKLQPLKCPHCGAVVKAKSRDHVYRCEHCGTFIYAPGEYEIKGKIFDFEIVKNAKRYYMPFLSYRTKAEIFHEDVKGILAQYGKSGEWITYIPAWGAIPAEETVRLGKIFTSNPPEETLEIDSFREVPPLSVDITIEEGERMAEFLFLSYEVERKGVLQRIDYSYNAKFKEIVYIPMYYDRYYTPGLRKYGDV